MVPGSQGSQDEPAAPPQDVAAHEIKKVSSKSVRPLVAAGSRGKSKARAAARAEPSGEAPAAAKAAEPDNAMPVQTPKRRVKLGVFKKSGGEAGRAPNTGVGEGVSVLPQAQAPSSTATAATARAPAKRKIPKRMARGATASADAQPNNSAAGDDNSNS